MTERATMWRNISLFIGTELFGPFGLLPGLLAVVAFSTSPHPWMALGTAVLFGALIPLGISLWLLKRGQTTNRYIVHRTQRHRFYVACVISLLTGGVLMVALPVGQAMQLFFLVTILSIGSAGVVNLVFKLSLHALVAAAAAVIIPALLGWWLVAIMVPIWLIVLWARVSAKQHTVSEVVFGSAFGAVSGVTFISLLMS